MRDKSINDQNICIDQKTLSSMRKVQESDLFHQYTNKELFDMRRGMIELSKFILASKNPMQYSIDDDDEGEL